jgi:histone H2B
MSTTPKKSPKHGAQKTPSTKSAKKQAAKERAAKARAGKAAKAHTEAHETPKAVHKEEKKADAVVAAAATPSKAKSPAKHSGKHAKGAKKHRKHKRVPSLSAQVHKVLKQVHPSMTISGRAMNEVCDFLRDMFTKIGMEAQKLARASKKHTVQGHDVQSAIRLILPGELAKHGVSEGTRAVTKYNAHATGTKNSKVSMGTKTGLQFRVRPLRTYLKGNNRVSTSAAVYLAAIGEYLCAELLELSGDAAKDHKRVRISARHVSLAVQKDAELRRLLNHVSLNGVVPSEILTLKAMKAMKAAEKAAASAKHAHNKASGKHGKHGKHSK